MPHYLLAAFKYYCCWLLFFFIERLLFIIYFFQKTQLFTAADISKSFLYGLWMDASMAAYVCALPLLFFIVRFFVPAIAVWGNKALRIYTVIILFICSLISVVNLNIYFEWGSKISYKVVEYATRFPKEAVASSSSSPIFLSLAILIILLLIGILLFKKNFFFIKVKKLQPLPALACSILLIGLEILSLRGGWQLAPMNESMAYFSNSPYLNHTAVNTEWSFVNDIIKNKWSKYGNNNPYTYLPQATADSIVHSLYAAPQATEPIILTSQKPNVVIFIIESFTADIIESLGGEKGIAPNMEQLMKNGILFTHIFASGDRTDKGTIAVLSGFPSQAITSILKFDYKQKQLPAIAQVLVNAGYKTSFYYGGESEFVNTKSYLLSHAYTRIIDKNSFNKKDMNSKWGAYDEVVLNRQLEDMNKEQQPFFSTILTLTNHEPFELPATAHFGRGSLPQMFKSTAYYTDSCIGDYMRKAAQEPWFANTLFILVADHGHLLPTNKYDINDYHRFRIPLLWYGGAIAPDWRGKTVDKIGSQTDIAATLLHQLNKNASAFTWSKDLLNPTSQSFAFYDWDNGFGFARPEQIISFDNIGKTITFKKNNASQSLDDTLLMYGKAYMQSVYSQFLKY